MKNSGKINKKEAEVYKKVWQAAATLADENGLAMPRDLMFKNFTGLDRLIFNWKVGFEESRSQKQEIKKLKKCLLEIERLCDPLKNRAIYILASTPYNDKKNG